MTEIVYQVKHEFKYNGQTYKPGDTWEPVGGKWDKRLIEHYMRVVPVAVTQAVIPPDIETVEEGGSNGRKVNTARKARSRDIR